MDWTENVRDRNSKIADSLARERERLYVSTDGKRTFEQDDHLPYMPVPDLEKTLKRYLESVRPHVSAEEYDKTRRICRDFAKGRGAQLQRRLQDRAKREPNWLDAWWQNVAYLRTRGPLIPKSNVVGAFGLFEYARSYPGTRAEYAAKGLHHYMQFWHLIRKETLKPQTSRGRPSSMDQFRKAFNTVRIPQMEADDLKTFFRTEAEQLDVPTHVIVLCRGHIFSLEMCDPKKEPLTVAEIAIALVKIENHCASRPRGKGVAALTCQEREQWAEDRQRLMEISGENRRKLELIEESLMVCVLDEESPMTRTEILNESCKGRCTDRWADKGLQLIFFANKSVGTTADHSPVDGMVPLCLSHWAHLSTIIDDLNHQPPGPVRPANLKDPFYVDFQLDDGLEMSLVRAQTEYEKLAGTIEVHVEEFTGYGKDVLKASRIYPEAFFQVVLQVAHMRMHGKPAAASCTISTRAFYRGRTEICRSCSREVVNFAQALIDKRPLAELGLLFSKAIKKLSLSMLECLAAEGCDRHLMGLAVVAWLENGGGNMPEIFTDPSFERSGGNGKFSLTTSLNGFSPLIGGVTPAVEDGYGCYYSFDKDQIIIALTGYKDHGTCTRKFYQIIAETLDYLKPLLTQARL